MAVKAIPEGYHTITPYLIVENATKTIEFLIKAFSAKEVYRSTKHDGTIGHAEVSIGDSRIMLAEEREELKASPASFYLYVENTDALYKQALQAGGVSILEPVNQFYGDRNAGIKDPEGNSWWIGTHIEDVTPEELSIRAKAAHMKG